MPDQPTDPRHERDYVESTIATVRIHREADNCWPQWANIFADVIEDQWSEIATLKQQVAEMGTLLGQTANERDDAQDERDVARQQADRLAEMISMYSKVVHAAEEIDDQYTNGLPASVGAKERLHVALCELDAYGSALAGREETDQPDRSYQDYMEWKATLGPGWANHP